MSARIIQAEISSLHPRWVILAPLPLLPSKALPTDQTRPETALSRIPQNHNMTSLRHLETTSELARPTLRPEFVLLLMILADLIRSPLLLLADPPDPLSHRPIIKTVELQARQNLHNVLMVPPVGIIVMQNRLEVPRNRCSLKLSGDKVSGDQAWEVIKTIRSLNSPVIVIMEMSSGDTTALTVELLMEAMLLVCLPFYCFCRTTFLMHCLDLNR